MKRLKLKKNAKKGLVLLGIVILFTIVIIYGVVNTVSRKIYESSYEYKLIKKGYSEEYANKLESLYDDKELEYILDHKINDIFLNITKVKYYKKDNLIKYVDYSEQNEGMSYDDVIRIINTHRDEKFYEGNYKTDTSKGSLMLVNKYYSLDEEYIPNDLVVIPQTHAWGEKNSQQVVSEVYDAYMELWNASHNAGFYLMVSSSYRDYNHQKSVYEEYEKRSGKDYADKIAARPGHSEHQTGLVLDIFEKGYIQSNFQESDSYKWLKENAYKYGFIERYPEDKVITTGYNYESWHYRYVGIEAAEYIYKNNITFDEYYAYFID